MMTEERGDGGFLIPADFIEDLHTALRTRREAILRELKSAGIDYVQLIAAIGRVFKQPCPSPPDSDADVAKWLSLDQHEIKFTQSDPHIWIQWKGTDVCADIHCACGVHAHIDTDFMYFLKCAKCGRVYEVNGNVQLIERDVSIEAEYQTTNIVHTFYADEMEQ